MSTLATSLLYAPGQGCFEDAKAAIWRVAVAREIILNEKQPIGFSSFFRISVPDMNYDPENVIHEQVSGVGPT